MMEQVKLTDVCNPKQWKTIPTKELEGIGFPVYGANGIIGYFHEYNHEEPVIAITCRGATCGSVNITLPQSYVTGNAMCLDNVRKDILIRYLYYCLLHFDFNKIISGSAQPQITRQGLDKVIITLESKDKQLRIVNVLDRLKTLIDLKENELKKLDSLIKARFVEMFGDLKANTNGWKVRSFLEFAKIDTVMIHDFSNYKHYPHIGIDSIEKDTGIIKGYRTVEEDGIVSGKYLFTDKHIIYSKIRPNLNKVAMPDFTGVCSADAYPILANENICNREFLTYVMRSNLFLDYILKFSSRTNLPKVNKEQVEGFACPIPSISIQKQFSSFVHQIDKSKVMKRLRLAHFLFVDR